MIITYAIALAAMLLLAAFVAWAFVPARYLPGNRARDLRVRLHLRLHPGKGFAHVFSLWLRWAGSRSCAVRAGSVPRSRCGTGSWTGAGIRFISGGPITGTGCRSRWKSTCW